MDVKTALKTRHSTRAFLDKGVPTDLVNEILEHAKHAPSGVNTQPWQVAVVTGQTKNKLSAKMETIFRSGTKGKMDYQYYPLEWNDVYKKRRKECGLLMYSTLNITREDKQKQIDQWSKNYRSFDAPVMLLFFIDTMLEKGSYVDYGMFLQSVMLTATSLGLSTCPQAALGEYPEIAREVLGYTDNKVLICGIALGYEDKEHLVNSYRTSRASLDDFVRYFD